MPQADVEHTAPHPDDVDVNEPAALPFKPPHGLRSNIEYPIFYTFAISAWCLEICAAATGSHYGGDHGPFIGTVTAFLITHQIAFMATAWKMATARRGSVEEVEKYFRLCIRLQRLMAPTAIIGVVTWAVAYANRRHASSSAYWIIYLVVWISNTVGCIINMYNNIGWETDRLYELGRPPQGNIVLHFLGLWPF